MTLSQTLELIFLGTSASVPTKTRNLPALALDLSKERQSTWLFDCGEATQHRILHTRISLSKLEKIFITHLHGDHIFGLPGLLGSRSIQGATMPLAVYGPPGIRAFIETTISLSGSYLTYPLNIEEISEGKIFIDAQIRVEARLLKHGMPSFGFRITEADLPGKLDAERLKKEGIPPGPLLQRLKNGETIKLEDGRQINGADYLGKPKKGRVIAIFGDNTPSAVNLELALNADAIVHETTFEHSLHESALKHQHSTTVQAAQLALEANAKKLFITHFSARYSDGDVSKLLEECRKIFPNTELATDLLTTEINFAQN